MNTTKRLQLQTCSLFNRLIPANRKERINTFIRCAGIMVALFIGACASQAADLPGPGEAIDAGDSYRLKDGSRLVLHRVVNEIVIETWCRFLPQKYGTHSIAMHPEFVAEWSITKLMRDQIGGIRRFQEVL